VGPAANSAYGMHITVRTVVQTDNELLAVIYTNTRPEPARFDLFCRASSGQPRRGSADAINNPPRSRCTPRQPSEITVHPEDTLPTAVTQPTHRRQRKRARARRRLSRSGTAGRDGKPCRDTHNSLHPASRTLIASL
jgi:hypothetical protein